MKAARLTSLGETGELGAAGIGEPEELGGLVKSFPGRIIPGLAEQTVAPDLADLDEHRVAAGDEERHVGKRRRLRLEQRREQVTFEVMNPERGHLPRIGETAGQGGPRQKGADQARTGGISDPVQVLAAASLPRP